MDAARDKAVRRALGCVCVALLVLTAAGASGQERTGVRTLKDLAYVPDGHERQKLDLYLPAAEPNAPRPLIVWVHGGAWQAGSKEGCPAVGFVEKGYAVASINYRLSRHAIFPAQIQDCQAAIRWLRAHANEYRIDPNRFGVWGASAGGHLVALLGVCSGPVRSGPVRAYDEASHDATTNETTPDPDDIGVTANSDVSSRVQAVCDFFGPTDFAKMSSFATTMDHDAPDSPESRLIGGPVQESPELVRRANPITYVTRDDPPFLIVHGDRDPLVPHNQSQMLYDALKKAGVEVTFYTVRGGGHGGFKDPQVETLVAQFFAKHLRP
ncbi:MAG TPA: alpha/beta hydrolase [Sedimentisphaerales bacterium]|nr:alpha/beta hydrolase [Sedimentisphaerales bacterium]HRS11467.1 alpha/beta hydrolase [Sedimentisphaerales bacterium]HRV47995.1 alpha/beta hydrolase [Sedimentisphaerales bacterium]